MKRLIAPLFVLLVFSACGGTDCPTISIAVYKVSVFDSVTGESLCVENLYFRNEEYGSSNTDLNCKISYTPSADDEDAGDINVSLDGYQAVKKESVPHNQNRYKCFDQLDYTEEVQIFLDSK